MTTATFIPGAQQEQALEAIRAWYHDEFGPQVFHLFGYAGTGKTELAAHVREQLGISRVCFAAYTGKAAHVLRTRGCDASTIHSLIYQPLGHDAAELARLQGLLQELRDSGEEPEWLEDRIAELEILIAAEQRKPKTLMFGLREESELSDADLLILDEVSMVDTKIAQDLLGFGVKILVLGDPAQLPPVGGAGYFTNTDPDYLLTEPHRFALDSPIIRIATSIRTSPVGDTSVGISGSDGNCGRFRGVRNLAAYDQVICGTNRTRWQLIVAIRALEDRYGPKPLSGDRIIILANSRDAGVYNGQQFVVLACEIDKESKGEKYMLRVTDETGDERDLRVWAEGFTNFAGEKAVQFSGRGLTAAATFAHAITVHKAQGSGFDKVLVVDESGVFRAMKAKDLAGKVSARQVEESAHIEARRWLYTAVTRAAQRVSVVLPSGVLGR